MEGRESLVFGRGHDDGIARQESLVPANVETNGETRNTRIFELRNPGLRQTRNAAAQTGGQTARSHHAHIHVRIRQLATGVAHDEWIDRRACKTKCVVKRKNMCCAQQQMDANPKGARFFASVLVQTAVRHHAVAPVAVLRNGHLWTAGKNADVTQISSVGTTSNRHPAIGRTIVKTLILVASNGWFVLLINILQPSTLHSIMIVSTP